MGAEPPTASVAAPSWAGSAAARPAEIGEVTEYVLKQGPVPGSASPRRRRSGRRGRRGRPPVPGLVSRPMFVLIVGCGRVGSSVARSMLRDGHEVSCLDEDPEAHARLEVGLESSWEDSGGQFTVGTAWRPTR